MQQCRSTRRANSNTEKRRHKALQNITFTFLFSFCHVNKIIAINSERYFCSCEQRKKNASIHQHWLAADYDIVALFAVDSLNFHNFRRSTSQKSVVHSYRLIFDQSIIENHENMRRIDNVNNARMSQSAGSQRVCSHFFFLFSRDKNNRDELKITELWYYSFQSMAKH